MHPMIGGTSIYRTSTWDPGSNDTGGMSAHDKIKGEQIYSGDADILIDHSSKEETYSREDSILGHDIVPSFFLEG